MFHVMPIYKLQKQLHYIVLLFSIIGISVHTEEYSIVFVHIGRTIPDYLAIAVKQARLFNPDAELVLIANKKAIEQNTSAIDQSCRMVTCESLTPSQEHIYFSKNTKLNSTFREGFWKYAFERFYYLNEFIQQENKHHIFHLEYDNMLYSNLKKLLPIFIEHYQHQIAATFDNDERCIPGFMYIPNSMIMQQLIIFMTHNIDKKLFDMETIGLFRKYHPEFIAPLPIMPPSYKQQYQLINKLGYTVKNPADFYAHIDQFKAIFDAAALGQYLGGIDPRNNADAKPGFINERCIFNPSRFDFLWKKDSKNRNVPYLSYQHEEYKIINLHIHSKKLANFTSYDN